MLTLTHFVSYTSIVDRAKIFHVKTYVPDEYLDANAIHNNFFFCMFTATIQNIYMHTCHILRDVLWFVICHMYRLHQ